MASTVWKGHLTFGLISVPVRLTVAARPKRVSFNMVNPDTMSRVKQQLFDPVTEKVVERKSLVKGAELEDGSYVLITDEDIRKVTPASSKTMQVLEFVKLSDVDPIYFDDSYYILPDGEAGEKPYFLLAKALEVEGYAAIARMVKSQRESIVIVRPSNGGLALHTLFYADEVRQAEGFGDPGKVELQEQELELGKMFIRQLAADFEPEKYHDTYRAALNEMIAARAQGREVQEVSAPAAPPALDLMAALKASLELPKKKPMAEVEPEAEEALRKAQ
ncbi:MAG: Ku protein [Vulcanimicrobiota bacterium]